jgi:hypothetical protein
MRFKNIIYTSALIFVCILSTTASPQKFKPLKKNSDAEQKAILENIKKNMADYDIHQCGPLSVINIKHDDKTIEVSSKRCRAFVQQTQHDIIKIYNVTGIQSVVGPDGHMFGYITWDFQRVAVRAEVVDANTMRINQIRKPAGAPGR